MRPASEKMTSYINDLKMNELDKPIVSNVTAKNQIIKRNKITTDNSN